MLLFLPGFGIGVILAIFHPSGTLQVERERFMNLKVGRLFCFTRLPTLHHIQMTCYSLTVHTLNLQLKVVALDSFQVVDSVLRYLETQSRMESYR